MCGHPRHTPQCNGARGARKSARARARAEQPADLSVEAEPVLRSARPASDGRHSSLQCRRHPLRASAGGRRGKRRLPFRSAPDEIRQAVGLRRVPRAWRRGERALRGHARGRDGLRLVPPAQEALQVHARPGCGHRGLGPGGRVDAGRHQLAVGGSGRMARRRSGSGRSSQRGAVALLIN